MRAPWLDWQRLFASVIGEQTDTGRYAYPVAVCLVPRQVGKTSVVSQVAMGRAMQYEDYRAAYTAQTGVVSSERFAEWFTAIEGCPPLYSRVKLSRATSNHRFTALATRSYFRGFPPKDGALRSNALDLVIVDEAQEHDELLGRALDATIIPTFSTRPRRQLIVIGTAGTERSAYLQRYVDLAHDGGPGVALIEYGATDDEDTDDEAVWHRRHPGLAGGLTDIDSMRTARATLGRAGFAREYMCRWASSGSSIVAPADWRACQTLQLVPPGAVSYSLDVAADRRTASITVCGRDRTHELIEPSLPIDFATARMMELLTAHGGQVAIDAAGPGVTVADELARLLIAPTARRRGLTPDALVLMTSRDLAAAYGDLIDDLASRTLRVRFHPALDTALAIAATRRIGDEGYTWSRRASSGNIAPLISLTGAGWMHAHATVTPARPAAYAG